MSVLRVHAAPARSTAWILSWVLFATGICAYFTVARQRHLENPDDRVTPSLAQMAGAFADAALKAPGDEAPGEAGQSLGARIANSMLWKDTKATGRRFLISVALLFPAVLLGLHMAMFPYIGSFFLRFVQFFDKIVALESAFHFRTREKFFTEAFRALRPGGVPALTDMIPLPGQSRGGLVARLERRFGTFEDRNLYDSNAYAEKLRSRGFVDISIESIRNDVYPGMSKFASASKAGTPAAEIVVELSEDDVASCRGHETWSAMGIGDYVMVRASKPIDLA